MAIIEIFQYPDWAWVSFACLQQGKSDVRPWKGQCAGPRGIACAIPRWLPSSAGLRPPRSDRNRIPISHINPAVVRLWKSQLAPASPRRCFGLNRQAALQAWRAHGGRNLRRAGILSNVWPASGCRNYTSQLRRPMALESCTAYAPRLVMRVVVLVGHRPSTNQRRSDFYPTGCSILLIDSSIAFRYRVGVARAANDPGDR